MSALIFLLIVLVVSGVGIGILWLQHRSPNTLESGIEAFQREMDALAPPHEELERNGRHEVRKARYEERKGPDERSS